MKRLKFLLVFVFLLVVTLTVFAFTNDKYRSSPQTWQCLRYTGTQSLIDPSVLLNSLNWTSMLEDPQMYCYAGYDLCAICFDPFKVTPNEARQILYDYVRYNGYTLPPHGANIYALGSGLKYIVVYKTMEE